MYNILKIAEIVFAILGVYYVILRIIAQLIYIKANRLKQQMSAPKYTLVENCPICGVNTIDIFENYDVNDAGEKFLVGYSIGCLHCGLRSPVLDSMEQCIDYWNTRSYKQSEPWIAGEPEIVYEEVKNGEEQGQITLYEQTNDQSAHIENDNL